MEDKDTLSDEEMPPCSSLLHRRRLKDASQYLVHCEICHEDPGMDDVVAGPVVEICSISVQPYDSSLLTDGKAWEICGVVEVKDGEGDTFEIYFQADNDPEIIVNHMDSPDSLLSLTLTEPVFKPFPTSTLKLHLRDRVRGLELASGTLSMDFEGNSTYLAESIVKQVKGEDGFGSVKFKRFPAAVIADIYVVFKMDDSKRRDGKSDHDGDIDAYGNMTASYHSNYGGSYPTTLFSKQKDEAVQIKYGTYIDLPRSLVVVPAYASALVIKSRLWDNDIDDAIFPIQSIGSNCKRIKVSNGLLVQVDVEWVHAYPKKNINYSSKNSRIAQPLSNGKIFRLNLPVPPSSYMMEIFSIFIVSNKDDVPDLYGYIEARYGTTKCLIFEKKKSDMFKCSKTITLVETDGPHEEGFGSSFLGLKVDLRDKHDKVFCKGYFAWTGVHLENSIVWSDRRICSIIPCEHCFAAIHYTIFSAAVPAKLKIYFSCNDEEYPPCDSITNVSGVIVATYTDHDYSTPYQREHYRSLLFSKPPESPSMLLPALGRNIPLRLSKSVVSVPLGSTLTIKVDLCATSKKNPSLQALQDVAKFHIGSESHWTIRSRDYSIVVSVELS